MRAASPARASARAAFAAGLEALRREQYEAGYGVLLEAAQSDPADADIQAYFSGACLAVGRHAEAGAAAERALALAPGAFAPRLKAGELALRWGDLNRAHEHYEVALRAACGTAELRAARAALAGLRRLENHSITHEARLPALTRLRARWQERRVARLAPRPGLDPSVIAGGSIE